MITHHATQYSDWGYKHTVASQEHKIKWLTSSCQNPWENIPEIQPRRQRRVCGVSFIRHALCCEQRREESVALSPKPTVRHLAWKWMTAGIENEQKAKDAFKLSLYIGKEASISTNNNNKKDFLKHHNGCCHLKAKKVSVFKINFKIGVFNLI